MRTFTTIASTLVVAMLAGCGGDGGSGGNNRDTTPPTVSLTTAAATVFGAVTLSATAADDQGVTQVDFLVDGAVIGSDSSAPFTFTWNTASAAAGAHQVAARAVDAAGNSTTSTAVAMTVDNDFTFNVVLAGAQEVPASVSLGAGTATIDVNVATGAVSGNLVITGMTATAAHIHDGFAGQNGPVVVGLTESTTTPGRWELPPSAALSAAQVQKLLAGGLYLNAHSAAYPGGEIRGQLVPPNVVVGFARLEGLQEVPEVTTSAAGQGGVTVNLQAGTATIHVLTRSVVDPTAAHLHDGLGGRNGPVLIPLNQDGSNPAHWSAVDQPIPAAAIASLQAGHTYLNVHTSANPGGEIRGQVATPGVLFVVNRLGGAQEVPANSSAGKGTVALTVDRTTRAFELHANVTGVDDASAAHIHEAYAGTNGSVIVPLTKDTADATHWSATGGTLTEAQYASLAKGKLYVNVHTPALAAGEIRGQLLPDGVHLVMSAMSGAQEVPPVVGTAAGTAATTVDLVARTVTTHVRSTGVDDATAAHIHRAAAGTNGSVIVPLASEAASPGHWFAEEQAVTDTQLQDFLGSLWYVNVHTPANPGGAIRGQIVPDLPPPPDTVAPTVTLAALPASVSGTVDLSATATDNVGVAAVRFLVNGTEIATDTTAPYSASWNTTAVANGSATVRATALDAAGNAGQSAEQTVTVANAAAAATLTQLQAEIFTPICAGCHTGVGAALPGVMNLSTAAASYAALVGVASLEQPAVLRVAPNDPAASYLVRKLEGDPSITGARMPQFGTPLTAAQMDRVKSWINAGALNN